MTRSEPKSFWLLNFTPVIRSRSNQTDYSRDHHNVDGLDSLRSNGMDAMYSC